MVHIGIFCKLAGMKMFSDENIGFSACDLTYFYVKRRHYFPKQSFYHTDHLDSNSFITNTFGYAEQHLQYLPFGELFISQMSGSFDSRYKFTAKERDNETGYDYFGARYYDSDLSVWLSVDPMSDEYPNISSFAYCNNNPIRYIDPNGSYIDPSKLSPSEQKLYNSKIKKLRSNKLFNAYYTRLCNSKTTYYIIFQNKGVNGSGLFNPKTNEIYISDDLEVIAQELFHAYQSDLGVYNKNDASVRETEADLVSANIMFSFDYGTTTSSSWNQDILFKYVDEDFNFNKSVLTSAFDIDFNKAVDARINFYKERERIEGIKAPASYIQENSRIGARALKELIKEVYLNK